MYLWPTIGIKATKTKPIKPIEPTTSLDPGESQRKPKIDDGHIVGFNLALTSKKWE